MTATVRYKFIKNTTGQPLTVANFPYKTDGDDKQYRFIRHILTAADIGTNPGQVGHLEGLILDLIPLNYNVIWFQVDIYRVDSVTTPEGTYIYDNVNNNVVSAPDELNMVFGLAKNNCLIVYDKDHTGTSPIRAGDTLTALVILGTRVSPFDSMISGQ